MQPITKLYSLHASHLCCVIKCSDNDVLETRVVQKPWVPKKEHVKDLDELINKPAKPPAPPGLEEISETYTVRNSPKLTNYSVEYGNILLNSVSSIETEMWRRNNDTLHQPGIVMLALEYIYDEVYRSS